MIPYPARQLAGRICSTLGILWAGAGAMKELFGTHVIAPFLPQLDLARVHEGSALLIGCVLYFVGAWLSRTGAASSSSQPADEPAAPPSQLQPGFGVDGLADYSNRSKQRAPR